MDKAHTVKTLFDEEDFRQKGHQLIDILADYLKQAQQRKLKTTNYKDPEQLLLEWKRAIGQHSDFSQLVKHVLDDSIHLHSPRYIGHQVATPAPITALVDLLVSLLNNGVGVYEMGASGTVVEKLLIERFCEKFGFEDGGGFFTSGGTLANLTVLLAARQTIATTDVWNEGTHNQLALLVSEEAHYCVDRAVRVMGWGEKGIIKIPVDNEYRMKTELIPQYIEEAKANGIQVIAVVGSAPSTSTGKYDQLEEIGKLAKTYGLWFHIDGAHGGSVIYSHKYKELIKGAEMADSIIFDTHKMMLTSGLATAVLFRKDDFSYSAFQMKADYLWEKSQQAEWHSLAKRTFECTKQMFALRIFFLLELYGDSIIEQDYQYVFDLARSFAKLIHTDPSLELAVEPDSNIVCFRWIQDLPSSEQKNACNQFIRKRLLADGQFYIVQTKLKGDTWLRISIMNPLTTLEDLTELLAGLKQLAGTYQVV